MRVVLVGRSADRDRIRQDLVEAGLEVVAEAATLAAARALDVASDAWLLATPDAPAATPARLAPDPDAPAPGATPEEPLTPRERDVLDLLALGLPNKAIAARLGISDQTVKFHVASIIGKLGARNRTDAVTRAVRRGMVAI
ncbi:MAG: response regulator transcription factor [Vicinamibacterales bacterium]